MHVRPRSAHHTHPTAAATCGFMDPTSRFSWRKKVLMWPGVQAKLSKPAVGRTVQRGMGVFAKTLIKQHSCIWLGTPVDLFHRPTLEEKSTVGGPQSHGALPNYTGGVSTTFKNRRAYFSMSWPVLLVTLGGLPQT